MRRRCGGLEHEVVSVLVADGGALSPGQVREALRDDLAYTTVMTVLARLSAKGVVTRERVGRAFVYRAVVDDDDIGARLMLRLLDVKGDRAAVLSRFVGGLSAEDESLLADLLHRTDTARDPDGDR